MPSPLTRAAALEALQRWADAHPDTSAAQREVLEQLRAAETRSVALAPMPQSVPPAPTDKRASQPDSVLALPAAPALAPGSAPGSAPAPATNDRAARYERIGFGSERFAAMLPYVRQRSQPDAAVERDLALRVSAAETAAGPPTAEWAPAEVAEHVADVLERAGWGALPLPRIKYDVPDNEWHFPGGVAGHYSADTNTIHLRENTRDAGLILHEVAHAIAPDSGHNETFTGVLLSLLDAHDPALGAATARAFSGHNVPYSDRYLAGKAGV